MLEQKKGRKRSARRCQEVNVSHISRSRKATMKKRETVKIGQKRTPSLARDKGDDEKHTLESLLKHS